MSESLTLLTMSRTPFERDVPEGMVFLNHVAPPNPDVPAHITMAQGRVDSTKKVQTEFVCWTDDDDPLPQGVRVPSEGADVLYGTELSNGKPYKNPVPWSAVRNLQDPLMVHFWVGRTSLVNAALDAMPKGVEFLPRIWVPFWIGINGGILESDPSFIHDYNAAESNHAQHSQQAMGNTVVACLKLYKNGVLKCRTS